MAEQTEQTPLLQTLPRRPLTRRRHGALILALIITVLCLVVTQWPTPQHNQLSRSDLHNIMLSTPDAHKLRQWSDYYTSGPHLCGQNRSQAEWTRDLWTGFGIPHVDLATYELYLNYPRSHRLALRTGPNTTFEAPLSEAILPEDPTSGLPTRIPTFHGYSANGSVTAPFVFCNYGTRADFASLRAAGVPLAGNIALVRYGRVFRGLKVRRAEQLGMRAVVMYSDPGDDGPVTEANGYRAYPHGPARNPSSVQRGSVQFLSIAPGDPTTPGYASKPGVPRQPVDGKIPSIPSLPISYADALPFLRALNNHGPPASSLPPSWHTGGLTHHNITYNIGPTPPALTMTLVNHQTYLLTPAWNVIGIINGTHPAEAVIIGNHRDAWTASGAADPHSGSAALNEVARALALALARGWKPRRTIILASWDGEEYGLLGSTEWVEDHLPWLSGAALAYLNIDIGVRGPLFAAAASPLLHPLLHEVTAQIPSPDPSFPGQTILDTWNTTIRPLGSGSDFTAFQAHAGVPSLDVGFDADPRGPVYHYHSNYDSSAWMSRFGDPGDGKGGGAAFARHLAIARLLALLVARLAHDPVPPLDPRAYARALRQSLQRLNASLPLHQREILAPLGPAIAAFRRAGTSPGAANSTRLKLLDRHFLHAPGLDGRDWFKHVVFAPGRWTGYAGVVFPGIVEALERGDEEGARRWVGIVGGCVWGAAAWLGGGEGLMG